MRFVCELIVGGTVEMELQSVPIGTWENVAPLNSIRKRHSAIHIPHVVSYNIINNDW